MARRSKSPIRTMPIIAHIASNPESDFDQRQLMIRKLKEDLIVERGKNQQRIITKRYYEQQYEQVRIIEAQIVRAQAQNKNDADLHLRKISQEKREVQNHKRQLRKCHLQLSQCNDQQAEWKKSLSSKSTQVQKLKKEAYYLQGQNFELKDIGYRLKNQFDSVNEQLVRFVSTRNDKQHRVKQIHNKIGEARNFIMELNHDYNEYKCKLKEFQTHNNGLNQDIDRRDGNIQILEQNFSEKHDEIKILVQNIVQLSHIRQRNIHQTQHNAHLLRKQTEKHKQLENIIKKTEVLNAEKIRDVKEVSQESIQIDKANEELAHINQQMKKDLLHCQQHLQNLMKQNVAIQNKMEEYIDQDNKIISVIRNKQRLPNLDTMQALRTSRAIKNSRNTGL